MNNWSIILIILGYLGLLFFIAFWAERNKRSKLVNSPYVYALSLAVYCSAWTYYGSVGMAARTGVEFLTIYLGPIIAAPLWIIVLKKIIQLSKIYNVSSIADFISLRYGNNRSLGAVVAVICALSIIPYIALQLKALSESFQIISQGSTHSIIGQYLLTDSTFYIALLLAVFCVFYGTITFDASKQKKGIFFSIAFESLVKLIIFIIIGIYICFYVFDGGNSIITEVSKSFNINKLSTVEGITGGINWYFSIVLSFLAIFLLPRQFQASVVEYSHNKQLKVAIWLFPLYLLLFNVFVIFIAWAGLALFSSTDNADYFTLLIPLSLGNHWLALMVFLGGLSAVISMVVVSTLALSTMLSNNLIIPYVFLKKFQKNSSNNNQKSIKNIRRVSIFMLIAIAYLLYAFVNPSVSLFSIGLVSFLLIVQLAPSFFVGLFWNRGSALGAKIGMVTGCLIVIYTYLLPFFTSAILGNNNFIEDGLFGIEMLKPYSLFGVDFLSQSNHSLFWSLAVNLFLYAYFSLAVKGNYRERNYGEVFTKTSQIIDLQEDAYVWKGEAYIADIHKIWVQFLGIQRANRALNIFKRRYNLSETTKIADARFINFSEKLLTGAVGSASAKILISNVVKEKPVSLVEVLKILEENKEAISINKSLKTQKEQLFKLTEELKQANKTLTQQDKLKDDFLDTVAHELKTPITSIQASSEILKEDSDIPDEIKQQFLSNILFDTQRITNLINDILNLEKLASGRESLQLNAENITEIIQKAANSFKAIVQKKKISISIDSKTNENIAEVDSDKLIQVFTNLISNSIKFIEPNHGKIEIKLKSSESLVFIEVSDNGKGLVEADIPYIFDKFYQSNNQTLKKPEGSGFGLAICKQIISLHKGSIEVNKTYTKGASFVIKLPKTHSL